MIDILHKVFRITILHRIKTTLRQQNTLTDRA